MDHRYLRNGPKGYEYMCGPIVYMIELAAKLPPVFKVKWHLHNLAGYLELYDRVYKLDSAKVVDSALHVVISPELFSAEEEEIIRVPGNCFTRLAIENEFDYSRVIAHYSDSDDQE